MKDNSDGEMIFGRLRQMADGRHVVFLGPYSDLWIKIERE